MRSAFPPGIRVDIRDELYLASEAELFAALQALDREACALVLAHEPGLSSLTSWLSARAQPDARAHAERGMVTAAFAALALAIGEWDEIAPDCGELVAFETPRSLDDAAAKNA